MSTTWMTGYWSFPAGPGSNNVHPDRVELNGTMNALSAAGLERLRHRFEEVRFCLDCTSLVKACGVKVLDVRLFATCGLAMDRDQ